MSDQQQQQTSTEEVPLIKAVVKAVLSGDMLTLSNPQRPDLEKTVTLAFIVAPRLAKRNDTTEEPFAFAAREYVRKRCIGKTVMFRVEYKHKQTGRDYATVFVPAQGSQATQGTLENLSAGLLREGLAQIKAKSMDEVDDELVFAQEHAQAKQLGVWTSDDAAKSASVRKLSWVESNAETAQKILKPLLNKPTNVIVEHVLNSTMLRVQLLPSHEMVVLSLTGVSSPPLRPKAPQGATEEQIQKLPENPIAKEGNIFVESRLLHRDIFVLFESVDAMRGNLLGTILRSKQPKDSDTGFITFQEELLSRGFAQISDWSIAQSKYMTRLKNAETTAKKARLRLWRDYVEPADDAKQLKDEDRGVIKARLIDIISGDMIRVRNLQNNAELKISLSSVRAPKMGFGNDKAEPWAHAAREFIRSKAAGRNLHITVDYRKNMAQIRAKQAEKAAGGKPADAAAAAPAKAPSADDERRFCTVTVGDGKSSGNLAQQLVHAGLASVIRQQNESERSPFYFQYLQAEKESEQRKLGMHSGAAAPPEPRNNNLAGKESGQVQKYFMLLKDKRCKAIVEKVFTGSRFRMYLPQHFFTINFALQGVSAPAAGSRADPSKEKPFGKAALFHTQNQVALREVEVLLEGLDKNGAFIGQMWTPEGNFAVQLLREGLALTTPLAKNLKNFSELRDAEESASKAKKNIWTLEDVNVVRRDPRRPEADDEDDVGDEDEVVESTTQQSFTVRLTEILDGTHFYYQLPESGAAMQRLEAIMSGLSLDAGSSYAPKEHGEIVFAKFAEDGQWYRAKVLSVEHKAKQASVLYVDFGSTVKEQPFSSLRAIAADAKSVPFQAKEAFLAFVSDRYPDQSSAVQLLSEMAMDRELQATIEYSDRRSKPFLTLVDPSDNTNINSYLARSGVVFVSKNVPSNARLNAAVEEFKQDVDEAKRARLGLYEHGDIFGDDDEY